MTPSSGSVLGEELGFTSLAIPEAYGGAGLGFVEIAAVMEEMGRALLCAPFFATVCLAATAVLAGGTEEQKRELLPGIAAGRTHRRPRIHASERTVGCAGQRSVPTPKEPRATSFRARARS